MPTGFKIKNLSEQDISSFSRILKDFMPYAQKQLGYDQPVQILFISDPENAVNPLGKTAHYEPGTKTVTIYVDGRHPKDMMRSVSHELVHHTQNCRGDFDNVATVGEGYAQADEHLREMERQAYEQGNLIFRDYEDAVKTNQNKQTIYITLDNAGCAEKKISEAGDDPEAYCKEVGVSGVKKLESKNMNKKDILKEIVSVDESGNRRVNRGMLAELVRRTLAEGDMADPGFKDSPFYHPNYVQTCVKSGFTENKNKLSLHTEHEGWNKFLNEGECAAKTDASDVETQAEGLNEYGDHETQASGGLVSSNYSSDPSMDQVEDLALTAIEQGGSLMQIATALQDQGFDANLSSGALMIQGTDREKYFIGKASSFEIGPDEETRQVGPYVLGHMDSSMKEGYDAGKEVWMKKYNDLMGDPQPKPQDYWDTAMYLHRQGNTPEEAVEKHTTNESFHDDYMDDLEEEFPWLAKAVQAKEIPAEVAAQLAKEYGDEELEHGAPVEDATIKAEGERTLKQVGREKREKAGMPPHPRYSEKGEDKKEKKSSGKPGRGDYSLSAEDDAWGIDEAEDGGDKEQQLRDIVDQKQMGEIDGSKVDLTSAAAIVKVLDAVNDQNKERFLNMPVDKMAQIAFKMMKEQQRRAS